MRYPLLVPITLSVLLAACAQAPNNQTAAASSKPALLTAAPRTQSAASDPAKPNIALLDQASIRARATQAELDGRIFAPAGDNAFELLLTLREAAPDQLAYQNALLDLMPMADRTIRHAIEQQDLPEAQRIADMLTRFDASSNVSLLAQERVVEAMRQSKRSEAVAVVRAQVEPTPVTAVKAIEPAPAPIVQKPAVSAPTPALTAVAGTKPAVQSAVVAAAQASMTMPASAAPSTSLPTLTRDHESEPGQTEPRTSEVDAALAAPIVLRRAAIQYPEQAKRQGVEGFVELDVLVDIAGNPTDIKVVRSQPAGLFDRAAIRAMMRWKFQPATRNGQVVAARTRTVIQFKNS